MIQADGTAKECMTSVLLTEEGLNDEQDIIDAAATVFLGETF